MRYILTRIVGRREVIIGVYDEILQEEHPSYTALDHAKRDARTFNLAGVPIRLRDSEGTTIDPFKD